MDNFLLLAMKEEVILEDEPEPSLAYPPQQCRSDEVVVKEEPFEQQESRGKTSTPLECGNAFPYDAERTKAQQIIEDTAYPSNFNYKGQLSPYVSDIKQEEMESCVHQQRKEETPPSALGPSEGANAALGDAEMIETSTIEYKLEISDDFMTLMDEEDQHRNSKTEVQSSPCAAGSSGQEEEPEPRTEVQGAGQEDVGRSCRGNKPKFPCNVCQKLFSTKSNLEDHMKNHTGEGRFTCAVCNRHFYYESKLRRHVLTHTGERAYVCGTCRRRFAHKHHLVDHARIHAGDKPYECATCGARFRQKSALAGHVRVHTGDRPFGCDTCGKRFIQKGHWRIHKCVRPKRAKRKASAVRKTSAVREVSAVHEVSAVRESTRVSVGEEDEEECLARPEFICSNNNDNAQSATVSVKEEVEEEQEEEPQPEFVCSNNYDDAESATVSVKEEEEECLARPEFIICSNNDDDAEEPMEQQEADPLSMVEIKMKKNRNCIVAEDSE